MYSKPTVNTHTQNLCQELNRELFPSLSSFALLSPSVPGLRQGKEPGRAASWNKSICRSRPGPAATEGLRRNVRKLSSSLQMQMTSPFLMHNNTLCSRRAESQLCPVNLNLWHTYSGCTYCCMDYKGICFQRGSKEELERRILALFLFEKWYESFT